MHVTTLLSLAASTAVVHAWGDVGHGTIGFLAQKSFTQASSDLVSSLLGDLEPTTLFDAINWADTIRRTPPFTNTGAWHYIDAQDSPPDSCGVKYSRDCVPEEGCAVSAIVNHTSILLDTSNDYALRTIALKFIMHIVGDIHQPLHTEKLDRGGNDIHACFDKHCAKQNLHAIWDTAIIHKYRHLSATENRAQDLQAAEQWADELHVGHQVSAADECTDVADPEHCALDWANEANAYICSYVLLPGVDWLESNDLGGVYYQGATPIVATQVARAASRLAAWINAISAQGPQRPEL